MEIQGKAVVLTGAASGIGRALLERLARVKCWIYAVDLSLDAMQQVVSALPPPRAQITACSCSRRFCGSTTST